MVSFNLSKRKLLLSVSKLQLILLLCTVIPHNLSAQGFIETGYTPQRNLLDKDDKKHGSGDLFQISGRYTLPLSVKRNEKGQVVAWSATINCVYSVLNNKDDALDINPKNILNCSFNISHRRPISDKWYLIASLGAGVYSSPNHVSFKSILANGAVIFAYKIRDNLDIGIGAGLTNSYGAPIIMPMTFLKWKTTGKYEIDVEVANRLKVSVTRILTDRFKLSLVPYDMDGISSVIKKDGESKIYGSTRLRSYLRPEFKIKEKSFIYLGIGADIYHSVKIADRSWKGFANSFKGNNEKWNFDRAFHVMAGFRYGF